MSNKDDWYDNAAMESWNHSFKVEALRGERFRTRSEAKHQVFEYIEGYYNRKRLHSILATLARKLLKLKKSLSGVFVKSWQDQNDLLDYPFPKLQIQVNLLKKNGENRNVYIITPKGCG